jgi:hypothetical protein
MKRQTVEFIHEGKYAAEVPVELISIRSTAGLIRSRAASIGLKRVFAP